MKYLFNSHPLQDESITIGLTKNMTVSFQLALTTKWILPGISWQNSARFLNSWPLQVKPNLPYTHNTRRCHFNSHPLRSVLRTYPGYQPNTPSFNSRSLRSVSNFWQHTLQILGFSTRTHYGVYRIWPRFSKRTAIFQLALTTECISHPSVESLD